MVKSMTGYGRAVQTLDGREITVELRAVNNRYLDCTVKLPRQLSFAEDAVKQTVRSAVSRGKVEVFVTVASPGGEAIRISLNRPVLEGYLEATQAMAAEYGVENDITVSALARFPDVFLIEKEKAQLERNSKNDE